MRPNSNQPRHLATILLGVAAAVALARLSTQPQILGLTINSCLLILGTCAISLPLGLLLSLMLTRTDVPGRGMALACLGAFLFVPLYLQCAGWRAALGPQGWYTLAFTSLDTPPVLDGWRGAIWVHAMAATPWVVLIVSTSLWFAAPELEEQALLSANPLRVFRHVTLRQAVPGIYVSGLWVAVHAAGEVAATDLFQVSTLAEALFTGYYLGDGDLEVEIGVWPGFCLFLAIVVAAWLLCDRLVPRHWPSTSRDPLIYQLRRWRYVALILLACLLLTVLGVPLLSLAYKAGVVVEQIDSVRIRSWSIAKFLPMIGIGPDFWRVTQWRYGEELAWSLGIGSLAALGSVLLATILAWPACKRGSAGLLMILTVAALFALPEPLVGRAIIMLLNQRDWPLLAWLYDHSILAPWLAMMARSLPLCMLLMWYALNTISTAALENASIDGAGLIARLVRVTLPQRMLVIACAWLIALAIATADLGSVILVAPPGVHLLSVRIFGLLHAGVEDEVAGICLANCLLYAVIARIVYGIALKSSKVE